MSNLIEEKFYGDIPWTGIPYMDKLRIITHNLTLTISRVPVPSSPAVCLLPSLVSTRRVFRLNGLEGCPEIHYTILLLHLFPATPNRAGIMMALIKSSWGPLLCCRLLSCCSPVDSVSVWRIHQPLVALYISFYLRIHSTHSACYSLPSCFSHRVPHFLFSLSYAL